MLQDIYPDLFDNHYKHIQPEPENTVLVFKEGKLLAAYEETEMKIRFPVRSEFSSHDRAVYLFSITGNPYFLILEPEKIPEGYAWYSIQELRGLKREGNTVIMAAFTAWHLWIWYMNSRFCGKCGAKTEFDTVERAMVCPECHGKIYPRINPAVIVGVVNGDRLLLTKYNRTFAYNALIAGFTEIGETLEETVRREVMEEAGLKVKNIRYYKSQPWGIAADILAGFYCEVDGDDTIHRDDNELKYAEWVRKEDIVLQPDSLSLTNEMMTVFKEHKGTRFSPPDPGER